MDYTEKNQICNKDSSKQFEDYEVLIPNLNLDVKDSEFRIGDITVKKMGEKSLDEFGMKKEFKNILVKNLYENIVDKTAVIIPVRGNNTTIICEDARKKADYVIRVLQVALSSQWGLNDLALLFKQNEKIIFRKKNNPSSVVGNWHRGHRSLGLEIDEGYKNRINKFLGIIQKIFDEQDISPKFRENFKRALIWIGRSIEEEDLDIKIVKLSIALETILTQYHDRMKGEALTSRMLLLNNIFSDEPFIKPAEILRIYILRSKIVHGSQLGIANKVDYLMMLPVAIDTIIYSIEVIRLKKLKNHSEFIETLNSHKGREKIIKWLKEQGDTNISDLIKYMEEPYLFSWDNVPGKDNVRLLEYLKQKYGVDLIRTAKIEKIDNNEIIVATENHLSLRLNNENTKVTLTINDVRTDEFIVKTENNKLNIIRRMVP